MIRLPTFGDIFVTAGLFYMIFLEKHFTLTGLLQRSSLVRYFSFCTIGLRINWPYNRIAPHKCGIPGDWKYSRQSKSTYLFVRVWVNLQRCTRWVNFCELPLFEKPGKIRKFSFVWKSENFVVSQAILWKWLIFKECFQSGILFL